MWDVQEEKIFLCQGKGMGEEFSRKVVRFGEKGSVIQLD